MDSGADRDRHAGGAQSPQVVAIDPPRTPNRRLQTRARFILGVGLAALGLWTLQGFLHALAWGAIFGIALWPSYSRVRSWTATRAKVLVGSGADLILLPALFTIVVALIFALPALILAIHAAGEARQVIAFVDGVHEHGMAPPAFIGHLPFGSEAASAWWQTHLATPDGAAEILGYIDRHAMIAYGRSLGAEVSHRLMLFGFMLLTLFFILKEGDSLVDQARRVSRRAFGPRGERIGLQVVASIHGVVNGLVLVSLIEGAILGILYALAGAPQAALLGGLTAVAAIVPFGGIAAVALTAMLLLVKGSAVAAIIVLALGASLNFIADHFVRPVLIGGATRLPFLWVLLGVLGGIETWGLLGLFFGPAIMAVLILLWREWAES